MSERVTEAMRDRPSVPSHQEMFKQATATISHARPPLPDADGGSVAALGYPTETELARYVLALLEEWEKLAFATLEGAAVVAGRRKVPTEEAYLIAERMEALASPPPWRKENPPSGGGGEA